MRVSRALPLVISVPLLLSSCSTSTSFEDPGVKEQAWDVYQCKEYRERPAADEATAVRADIDQGAVDDEAEAKAWAKALDDAAEHSSDATVGFVMPLENRDGMDNMCTGWPWEYRTSQDDYRNGFEVFTEQDAKDAGVLVEHRQPLF